MPTAISKLAARSAAARARRAREPRVGAVGCAGLGGRRWGEHPVTITEVVILSQHGVAPEKIIGKMRRGGTVYHLSEEQYAALRKKGVTPAVIAYMQQSPRRGRARISEARRRQGSLLLEPRFRRLLVLSGAPSVCIRIASAPARLPGGIEAVRGER